MEPVVSKGSKDIWGPLLWKLFHSLAEVSDRRDVLGYWRVLFKTSAASIPCPLCRLHFEAYLRVHPMTKLKKPILTPGKLVKEHIRTELWAFHNAVNESTAKPIFTKAEFDALYATKTRAELLNDAKEAFVAIQELWNPLMFTSVNQTAYRDWKKTFVMLFSLTSGGPN